MSGLSEKAKGKRRAVELPVDEAPEPPAERPLIIRFTEGLEDLRLALGRGDTVHALKKKVGEFVNLYSFKETDLAHFRFEKPDRTLPEEESDSSTLEGF